MAHIFEPPADVPDIPDRFQTMSIASTGECTIARNRRDRAARDLLAVDDIPGARSKPSLEFRELRNRPTFHDPRDVKGSAPSVLHPKLNKVSRVCTNDDIEGSKSKPSTFKTRRVVDPMAPQYALPKVATKPVTPPPMRRETNAVDDIPGTKPSQYHKYATRDSFNVSDIPGTHPEWKPQHKQMLSGKARDIMRVDDITGEKFKTRRVTDPLAPTHVINGMVVRDDDPRMKPKPLPKGRAGPVLSLTTADIEGANTDFKPKHTTPGGITEENRRQFRHTNLVEDIDGAVSGTLKRAIRTKRVTNPNERDYPTLDGSVHHVPTRMAHQLQDPKDAELARLRAEVQSLRKDAEIRRLEEEIVSLRDGGRPPRPRSTVSTPVTPAGTPSYRDGDHGRRGLRSSASMSSTYSHGSSVRGHGASDSGGGRPPASRSSLRSSASTPLLPGGGPSRGSSVSRDGPHAAAGARGSTARSQLSSSHSVASLRSSASERRVEYARVGGTSDLLRLGTPVSARSGSSAVSAAAARSAARRAEREAREAVDSVASLPDAPSARSGLARAGSASLMT